VVRMTEGGKAMADSRDVAAYFGKEHKHVLRDIREARCSEEFRRSNFGPFNIKDLTGESTSHVMMTKNGFTFLAMGFTGERAAALKERYIAQFDAMEAQLAAAPRFEIPKSLSAALRLAADQAETIEKQTALITAMQPKADALDRIATAQGSFNITDAAKALQVRPKDLFSYLSSHGWIYRRAGSDHWLGYQARVQTGDLEHKVKTVLRADGR